MAMDDTTLHRLMAEAAGTEVRWTDDRIEETMQEFLSIPLNDLDFHCSQEDAAFLRQYLLEDTNLPASHQDLVCFRHIAFLLLAQQKDPTYLEQTKSALHILSYLGQRG